MNYESFLALLKEELKSYLEKDNNDSIISIKKVLKNNGIELDALTLVSAGCSAAPTIYLNNYYTEYQEGRDIREIVEEIYEMIKKNSGRIDFKLDDFMDFHKIKNRIVFKVVNADSNKKLLGMAPHIRKMDLAIVFYCVIQCNTSENATTMIYNQHLEMWNVDLDTIYETAKNNTPVLLPWEIKSMADIIREMIGEDEELVEECSYNGETIEDLTSHLMEELTLAPDTPQMYVLTNKFRLNGAASMFYEGVLKKFAEEHDRDLIVLPSSVHEVILIPMEKDMLPEHFDHMVKEVNREEVEPSEILSNHAYVYKRDQDELLIR